MPLPLIRFRELISLSRRSRRPTASWAHRQIYQRRQDFVVVKQILAGLSDAQLRECPYFLFFRGIMRFAAVLSHPEEGLALTGLPLDVATSNRSYRTNSWRPSSTRRPATSSAETGSEGLELKRGLQKRPAETLIPTGCDLFHPRL